MKKLLYLILICLFVMPINIYAQRGCCSHHGGVSGCSESGRQICKDGTLSPSCTCQPPITTVYGCTDSKASNYNPNANADDNSCEYKEQIIEKEIIEYETIENNTENKNSGEKIITQKGQKGEKEIVYEVIKDNNNNVKSKTKISENITVNPIDEIIDFEDNDSKNSNINKKLTSKNNINNTKNNETANSFLGIIIIISIVLIIVYRFKTKRK